MMIIDARSCPAAVRAGLNFPLAGLLAQKLPSGSIKIGLVDQIILYMIKIYPGRKH